MIVERTAITLAQTVLCLSHNIAQTSAAFRLSDNTEHFKVFSQKISIERGVMDTHPFGSAEPSRGGGRRVAAQGLATTGLGPGVQNIERCMSKI